MALEHSKPEEGLARELREVARNADALIEALTKGLNFKLPPDFPAGQLLDIARSLSEVPTGTAGGCRYLLEYGRSRLPAIRRAHVVSEELDFSTNVADAPLLVVRGTLIDQRLRDLIASVTTAFDEYQRLAAEELEEPKPETGVSAPASLTANAIGKSVQTEARLNAARQTLEETANPESAHADNLKRQFSDASGLNRLARAELRMPKMVLSWYRRIVDALKDYPGLLKKTATGLKEGADVLHLGFQRWHDFERNATTFLFDEFKKTCDAFIAIAVALERKRPQKIGEARDLPGDFDRDKARAMLLLGNALPGEWRQRVTSISLSRANPANLTPLSECSKLRRLTLRSAKIESLEPLSGLPELEWLDLHGASFSDLSPIATVPSLRKLDLSETEISDLGPLAKLAKLRTLDLQKSKIKDISALANLGNLEMLWLQHSTIEQVPLLQGLGQLQLLDLSGTKIRSLSGLSELPRLKWLDVSETLITDFSPISRLNNLETLIAGQTRVRDLGPLSGLLKLKEVYLGQTDIIDLSPLSALPRLENIDLHDTPITTVAPLRTVRVTASLNLSGTKVTDLAPVSHVKSVDAPDGDYLTGPKIAKWRPQKRGSAKRK